MDIPYSVQLHGGVKRHAPWDEGMTMPAQNLRLRTELVDLPYSSLEPRDLLPPS